MQSAALKKTQDAYRRQSILTASPLELIIMLYDGLEKNIRLGQKAIVNQDAAAAHEKLMKAQDIVTELMNCLDLSFPIAESLLNIYEFILRTLEEANIKKNAEALDPLLEITESLRAAWREISGSVKTGEATLAEDLA